MMPCDTAVGDVLEVHRVALDETPEADHRVVTSARRQTSRGQRDLEGAGHANERDVRVVDAGISQRGRVLREAARR